MTSSQGTLGRDTRVDLFLSGAWRRRRGFGKTLLGFISLLILAASVPMDICHAEQSLVHPLHYGDDLGFYNKVFMHPFGRRRLDENQGSPITIDRFHLTGYDDQVFYKRHKFMIVNDSSQGGSVALIACILNGDEAIEFSKRMVRSDVVEDDQLHPWGFATLKISGTIAMYNDGPSQQPRVVLAIDPCHVGTSFGSGKRRSYSEIRAPIRRWSQYYDSIIPNFDAALPYY